MMDSAQSQFSEFTHEAEPDTSPADKSVQFEWPHQVIRDIDFHEAVIACIWAAFPGPSAWAVAGNAAGPLQADQKTIYRILGKQTQRIDGQIVALAFVYGGHLVKHPQMARLRQAIVAAYSIKETRQ